MLIKNKNSAPRIEVPCHSDMLWRTDKDRVVILVDTEFCVRIASSISGIYLTESEGRATSHLPVVSGYYAYAHFVSYAGFLFNKKRICRINPLPDQVRKTFVFDERLSNFHLSDATKQMLLHTNVTLHARDIRGMTNFGEFLDQVGPDRFKHLIRNMHIYDSL